MKPGGSGNDPAGIGAIVIFRLLGLLSGTTSIGSNPADTLKITASDCGQEEDQQKERHDVSETEHEAC